jgi:DNA-binding MarR family transcriptional regulator
MRDYHQSTSPRQENSGISQYIARPRPRLTWREARFYDPRLGRQWLRACRDLSALFDLLASFGGRSGQIFPSVTTLARRLGWARKKVHKRLAQLKTMGLISAGSLVCERGPRYRFLHPEMLERKKLPPFPRVENFLATSDESGTSAHDESGTSGQTNRVQRVKRKAVRKGSRVLVRSNLSTVPVRFAHAVEIENRNRERQALILNLLVEKADENYPLRVSRIAELTGLHRRVIKPLLEKLVNVTNGLYVSADGRLFWPMTGDDPDWDEYQACGLYDAPLVSGAEGNNPGNLVVH